MELETTLLDYFPANSQRLQSLAAQNSPTLAMPNGTHHDSIAFVFSERFEALLGSGIDVPSRRHG